MGSLSPRDGAFSGRCKEKVYGDKQLRTSDKRCSPEVRAWAWGYHPSTIKCSVSKLLHHIGVDCNGPWSSANTVLVQGRL